MWNRRNAEEFRRITRFLIEWIKHRTGEEMFGGKKDEFNFKQTEL